MHLLIPKRNKPLGEISEGDLMAFSRWAIALEDAPEDKDGKLFYANIKMMMAEKGWSSPTKLLVNSILTDDRYTNEYGDEDIEGYFQAEAGKTLDDLHDEEVMNFIGDYENVVEEIVDFAKKPKKTSKKAKATMPE